MFVMLEKCDNLSSHLKYHLSIAGGILKCASIMSAVIVSLINGSVSLLVSLQRINNTLEIMVKRVIFLYMN